MSAYARAYAAFSRRDYTLPAKFGWFLGAWALVCTHWTPEPGMMELPLEEWAVTPPEYLQHPTMHPKLLSRAPEQATVENKREQLFKQYAYVDTNKTPSGHGHH